MMVGRPLSPAERAIARELAAGERDLGDRAPAPGDAPRLGAISFWRSRDRKAVEQQQQGGAR